MRPMLLASTLVLSLAAGAIAAAGDLARYADLPAGAYMQNRPWGDAPFKAALTASLKPKAPLARLYRAGPVVGPSRKVGDATVFWACRAHDCSDVQAHVYLDAQGVRLRVCWRDAAAGGDFWLETGKPPEHLPDRSCGADDRADAAYRAHTR